MNQYLNEELINIVSRDSNLTKLALTCMGYRFRLLMELRELELTEQQGIEFEELKHFFYLNGIRVKEGGGGEIYFEYGVKWEAKILPMPRRKPLPSDVITEFLCNVEIKGDWMQISEQIASQQYENMEALIETVRGYVKNPKRYEKYILAVKDMDFYRPHFKQPIPRPVK